MSETKIPGTSAVFAVISPKCREVHGNAGALEEAFKRVRDQYEYILEGWKDSPQQPTLRLVLTNERPIEIAEPQEDNS